MNIFNVKAVPSYYDLFISIELILEGVHIDAK